MRYVKGLLAASVLSLSQGVMAESPNAVRVIVKYKQTPYTFSAIRGELDRATPLPIKTCQPMAAGAYVLTFDDKTIAQLKKTDPADFVLEHLKRNPNVIYAVKDRIGHVKPLPKTPNIHNGPPPLSHKMQWDEFSPPAGIMLESLPGLMDGAWYHTTGWAKTPVVIAVLDTGIAIHDALVNSLLKDEDGFPLGWNFAANNHNLYDETQSYHGTHVAGTIAGFSDVMSGIGKDLKILPVKIPDESGMFYESSVINAMYWSVGEDVPGVPENPYPAQVLNMSFGVDEKPGKEVDVCDEALQDAVDFVARKGATVVVAAGNDNHWEHLNAPAVCKGTIKVASTGPKGFRAYYSNYGPSISFAAPGGDQLYGREGGILSTVKPNHGYNRSGYDFYQGTSMASPHVAGVAGLIAAVSDKALSPAQIEQILFATTHSFGTTEDANKSCLGKKPCGHGIVNAQNAVKAAMAKYDDIFSAPKIDEAPKQAHWIPIESAKKSEITDELPHVYQDKDDGEIHAVSGGEHYKLDKSGFSQCDIIGFDGIGCHR